MKKIIAALLAIAFCMGFWACNSKLIITEETIVGAWVTPVESQNLNRYSEYTFDENGNGNYRIFQDGEASERQDFRYKLEDGILTLTINGEDITISTEYDGKTLTLTRNDESTSLTKAE